MPRNIVAPKPPSVSSREKEKSVKIEHVTSPEGVITLTITPDLKPPNTSDLKPSEPLRTPLLCRGDTDPRPETATALAERVFAVWKEVSRRKGDLEEALLPFVCWAQPAHNIREREAQARAIRWAAATARASLYSVSPNLEVLADQVERGEVKVL
jgi:hypothetical protein